MLSRKRCISGAGRALVAGADMPIAQSTCSISVDCAIDLPLGGRGPQAAHEEVQRAAGLGVLPGFAGHGKDADQAGGDVLGADVGAQVAGGAAGVKDRFAGDLPPNAQGVP